MSVLVGEKTVAKRMEWAMDFLMNHRYNKKYGLIWGATTANWGVYFTDDTHYALDIYDNALFLIALDNLMELLPAVE